MIKNAREFQQALAERTILRNLMWRIASHSRRSFRKASREVAALLQNELEEITRSLEMYLEVRQLSDHELDLLDRVSELPALLVQGRLTLGWTQAELAERVGVKRGQISRYEANSYKMVGLSRAIDIADLFYKELSVEKSENRTCKCKMSRCLCPLTSDS